MHPSLTSNVTYDIFLSDYRFIGNFSVRNSPTFGRDTTIDIYFLPNWQKPPGELERDLLALPTHLVGIGLQKPATFASAQFCFSNSIYGPFIKLVNNQSTSANPVDCSWKQLCIKTSIQGEKRKYNRQLPFITNEALTFRSYGYFLVKIVCPSGSQFYQSNLMDSHYIRQLFRMHYVSAMGGPLRILLHIISVANPLQQTICCLVQWEVPSIRQNEICDITASFFSEVCHNMCQ